MRVDNEYQGGRWLMKTKMDGLEVVEQWPNYHNYTFHITQSTKGKRFNETMLQPFLRQHSYR